MGQPGHLARPIMSATAGLHHHDARFLFSHELLKSVPRQLLPKQRLPRHRSPVNLNNMLCQVHANHRIFRHGCRPFRSVAVNNTILAHCDAVWGGRQPPHLTSTCCRRRWRRDDRFLRGFSALKTAYSGVFPRKRLWRTQLSHGFLRTTGSHSIGACKGLENAANEPNTP